MYSNPVICCEKDTNLKLPWIRAYVTISADTFTFLLDRIDSMSREEFVNSSSKAWLPKAHVEIERLRLVDGS